MIVISNMRAWSSLVVIVLGCAAFLTMEPSMAYEEPRYKAVEQSDLFELRDYEPHLVAEVQVSSHFDDVGDQAFKILFDYISGNNISQEKISMTTPVTQQPNTQNGERIAMTTPVLQTPEGTSDESYRFSFVMPSDYAMETLPKPADSRVKIRAVPGRLIAARRYSGNWSEDNYRKNEVILLDAIEDRGLKVEGAPIYARYNSPFSLWFLRRNEVMVEVTR